MDGITEKGHTNWKHDTSPKTLDNYGHCLSNYHWSTIKHNDEYET